MDARQQWMAYVLQQALEYQLITADDLLRYATPRVIATLPTELKARILRSGLNQGVFTPDVVLSAISPELLAEHVPLSTLWGCIAEAGQREFAEAGEHERAAGDKRMPADTPATGTPAAADGADTQGLPPVSPPGDVGDPFEGVDPDGAAMIVIEEDGDGDDASWSATTESTGIDASQAVTKGRRSAPEPAPAERSRRSRG